MEQSTQQTSTELDMMAGELTKQVCCIKYSLMACNAFGIMLGIFVVLFGISYPEEGFPGGYKGRDTAAIAGFFIIFTLIGYYGAHRQKVYFLVPYSVIIFLFLGGNLMMWGIKPEESVLDPDSNAVLILAGVYLILMVFALWLAMQERKKGTRGNVQITSTAGLPLQSMALMGMSQQMPAHLRPQEPQRAVSSTGVTGASTNSGSYGYQRSVNQMDVKNSWDLNDLNVLYQPASNSYITVPASRYGSVQGPLLMY